MVRSLDCYAGAVGSILIAGYPVFTHRHKAIANKRVIRGAQSTSLHNVYREERIGSQTSCGSLASKLGHNFLLFSTTPIAFKREKDTIYISCLIFISETRKLCNVLSKTLHHNCLAATNRGLNILKPYYIRS